MLWGVDTEYNTRVGCPWSTKIGAACRGWSAKYVWSSFARGPAGSLLFVVRHVRPLRAKILTIPSSACLMLLTSLLRIQRSLVGFEVLMRLRLVGLR